jgi:hypothetical protein
MPLGISAQNDHDRLETFTDLGVLLLVEGNDLTVCHGRDQGNAAGGGGMAVTELCSTIGERGRSG